jgi:hypothetical protein
LYTRHAERWDFFKLTYYPFVAFVVFVALSSLPSSLLGESSGSGLQTPGLLAFAFGSGLGVFMQQGGRQPMDTSWLFVRCLRGSLRCLRCLRGALFVVFVAPFGAFVVFVAFFVVFVAFVA